MSSLPFLVCTSSGDNIAASLGSAVSVDTAIGTLQETLAPPDDAPVPPTDCVRRHLIEPSRLKSQNTKHVCVATIREHCIGPTLIGPMQCSLIVTTRTCIAGVV